MANRDMDNATQTEVAKPNITGFELLEIELDDGTHRFTNGPFDTTFGGNTFQALGNFLGFSDIQENTQMQIAEVTITLTGLRQQDFGYFVNNDFIDRTVRIYRQLWNDRDGIVGTFKIFEGRFSSAACEDDGEQLTVGGVAANQFVDFERTAGRRTNNDEQQFYYPGDKFFEFAKEVLKEVKWQPPQ